MENNQQTSAFQKVWPHILIFWIIKATGNSLGSPQLKASKKPVKSKFTVDIKSKILQTLSATSLDSLAVWSLVLDIWMLSMLVKEEEEEEGFRCGRKWFSWSIVLSSFESEWLELSYDLPSSWMSENMATTIITHSFSQMLQVSSTKMHQTLWWSFAVSFQTPNNFYFQRVQDYTKHCWGNFAVGFQTRRTVMTGTTDGYETSLKILEMQPVEMEGMHFYEEWANTTWIHFMITHMELSHNIVWQATLIW